MNLQETRDVRREIISFYPCPRLRGLVLKTVRHGDVTAGARAAERRRTSKFRGVTWHKKKQRWRAQYSDANGKQRSIGYYDTQEAAAHAYNAAIRRAGLEGRRKTNPVVDGQLVPKPPGAHNRKRRRDEPAATPSPRSRRR